MFTEAQVEGNINSVDRQLLYDIRNELRALNQFLQGQNTTVNEENKPESVENRRGRKRTDIKEVGA